MFRNSSINDSNKSSYRNDSGINKSKNEVASSLKIVFPYLIISAFYILFSDRITEAVAGDFEHITILQTIKGWGFVLITSIILFIFLKKHFRFLYYQIQQKEEKLKEIKSLESNFRLLFENSGEAILLATPDGKIYSGNPEACRIFQRAEGDLCSAGINGIVDTADTRLKNTIQQKNNYGKFKGEINFIRKDGSKFTGEITSNMFLNQDGSDRISMIIRDITERVKAEKALRESGERFHAMFKKHMAVMLLINPEDGRIIDANDSAVKFYGYPMEQLTNMNIQKINTLPADKIFAAMGSAKNVEQTHFIFPHQLSSGEIKEVEVYSSPIEVNGKKVLFSVNHDITEKVKADREVFESREKLRALTARLEKVKEDERINLARELHDNLGQRLTGLKMDAAWLKRKINEVDVKLTEPIINRIDNMSSMMDELIREVRRISSELRPNILSYVGLLPALEWLVKDFEKNTEIKTEFISKLSGVNVNPEISSSVYRIYQEAFTNIIRHANATLVQLVIDEEDDKYRIELRDNGKGISETELNHMQSLGVTGMKERAVQFNGELKISNQSDGGTSVLLIFPKS